MKHIKAYEKKKKEEPIELIGYPEGNIIYVTKKEFEELQMAICLSTGEEFDISWDDEVDYDEGSFGQWRFKNDEEDEIEEWLEIYRKIGDPELVDNIRKYNV